MAIYATKPEGGDFVRVEPGTYVARCYSMIHIGHVETEYNGEKKVVNQVNLTWELPDELAVFNEEKGPEPYVVSKTYTLSMHEKSNLRKDLESWRGKGFTEAEAAKFDITKLLGVPCILSIVHKPGVKDPTKTYTVVSSISRLMRGQECPPPYNKSRVLSYDDFDWDIFNSLSDFMKEKIQSSQEFRQMQTPQQISAVDDIEDVEIDNLPF